MLYTPTHANTNKSEQASDVVHTSPIYPSIHPRLRSPGHGAQPAAMLGEEHYYYFMLLLLEFIACEAESVCVCVAETT